MLAQELWVMEQKSTVFQSHNLLHCLYIYMYSKTSAEQRPKGQIQVCTAQECQYNRVNARLLIVLRKVFWNQVKSL